MELNLQLLAVSYVTLPKGGQFEYYELSGSKKNNFKREILEVYGVQDSKLRKAVQDKFGELRE